MDNTGTKPGVDIDEMVVEEEEEVDEIRLGFLVDELNSVVGKEFTQAELIQAILNNNYDLRTTVNSLTKRAPSQPRESPEKKVQGSGVPQYQLPNSFCRDSAIIIEAKQCERLPLNKLIREWLSDILRKRSKEKRKEERVRYTRRRNESQCSEDSVVTTSGESQDVIDDTNQDLSEDSQEMSIDYFDLTSDKNSEEMSDKTQISTPMVTSSLLDLSSLSTLVPELKKTHTCQSSLTTSFASPGLPICSPETVLDSSKSSQMFCGYPNDNQFLPAKADVEIPECSLNETNKCGPVNTVHLNNHFRDPVKNLSNLSSLANASLGNTGPKLSSHMTALSGNAGPSLSSLASASLENPGPSLPSLPSGTLPNSGISLSSLARASLGNTRPSLSSLAGSSLGNIGLSSLANFTLENTVPSLPSFFCASLENTRPSLSSLASTSLGNTGPSFSLSSLSSSSLGNVGPSLSSLASASLGKAGPSLSSLASSSLGNTESSLPSFVGATSGNTGPSLSSLANTSLGNTNPNLSSISYYKKSAPQDIKTSDSCKLESSSPSLSTLASSYLTGNHPTSGIYFIPPLRIAKNGEFSKGNCTASVGGNCVDIPLSIDSGTTPNPLKSPWSTTSCRNDSLSPVDPSQDMVGIVQNRGTTDSPSGDISCLSSLRDLSVSSEFHVMDTNVNAHSVLGLRPPPGFERVIPQSSMHVKECLEEVLRQEEEADVSEEIDLKAALMKSHIPEKIEVDPVRPQSDLIIEIQTCPFKYSPALRKNAPSSFGRVMVKVPHLPKTKRLTEKTIYVPFKIFRFDTPSPDELIQKALQNHKSPEWYKLVSKERHSRR